MAMTPAEERTLAWKTLPCRTTTCLQPAGRRCITASGERTSPHAPRIADIRTWLSRQPEVDALNALVTSLRAANDQLTAALQTSDDKADMLAGQIAGLQTDLAAARARIAELETPPTPEPAKQLLVGAGGGNSDRTKQKIDIDRRYYGGADSDITKLVSAAKANHAAGILTWATFKLPVSWADAVAGKADAWFDKLAAACRGLGFGIWIDLHHEPEGDGDGNLWRQFNARFANRLGDGATGPVKFLLCVTGYSEEYGTSAATKWDTYWPTEAADKIYAIAYDNPYLRYGAPLAGGALDKTWSEGKDSYVTKLAARARSLGVKAAIGEFGYSDEAFAKDPAWLDRALAAMAAEDVIVGACYFDSNLNSTRSWQLGTGAKRARFESAAAAVR